MEERLSAGTTPRRPSAAAADPGSLDPPSDVHAQADYRRHLAEVSAVRAVLQAAERARGERADDFHEPDDHGRDQRHHLRARRPASLLLVHFIRDDLDLTGTTSAATRAAAARAPCGSGATRSRAAACSRCRPTASITTVEGLASDDGELTPLQESFREHHGLQCGYCTPGMLMSATALLEQNPRPSEHEVKVALQGNICRCTGYWNIVEAVVAAGEAGAR
jgi:aerobic-type carbon monoxide dehydrogenase small subunit (CoxS/CutS family)